MTTTVGIAGITGKFARLLVKKLLEYPDLKIKGYCRNVAKVPLSLQSDSRVEIVQGDASDGARLADFVTGCDVVACCYLGGDDLMLDGQKALIDACEAAHVSRYIAGDWCLEYTKLELGQLFPKDPMIHIKSYLESKKHVKGVHILVGGFMDPQFSSFFGVLDASTTTFRYWGDGNEIWEGTSYENAAEYTAAIATNKDAAGVQRVIGGRASFLEITGIFGKVYNVTPKLEKLGSLDDLYKHMHELRAQSPAEWYKYMPLFFTYYWLNGQTYVGPEIDNSKYPQVKPQTWEDFMKARTMEQLTQAYASLSV